MKIVPTLINDIRVGDVILHNGVERTVNAEYIKRDPFWGTTLFGDSYWGGHKPVMKVILP